MRGRGARGFSLVEGMVAGAVFALGIVAMFSATTTMSAITENTRRGRVAISILDGLPHWLLSSSDPSDRTAGTHLGHFSPDFTPLTGSDAYDVTWTVAQATTGVLAPTMCIVRAEVAWQVRGTRHSITSSTAIPGCP